VQRARAALARRQRQHHRTFTSVSANSARAFEEGGGRIACVSAHGVSMDAVLLDNKAGWPRRRPAPAGLGHRDIAVISGPAQLLTVRHRLEGATDALADAGVPLPENAIVPGDFSREGGRLATLQLLEQAPKTTAIFALNDLMARGVLMALESLGRKVPEEISVIGSTTSPSPRTPRRGCPRSGCRWRRSVPGPCAWCWSRPVRSGAPNGSSARSYHAKAPDRRRNGAAADVRRPVTVLAMQPALPAQLFDAATMQRLVHVAEVDPDLVLTDYTTAPAERTRRGRGAVHLLGRADGGCYDAGDRAESCGRSSTPPAR